MKVLFSILVKKCNEQLGRKKWKKIFQTKKNFITCSKLIINGLGHCPTRYNNVYFAINEQASLAFTAAFCFAHAEHNLIKLKLYINWSAQCTVQLFLWKQEILWLFDVERNMKIGAKNKKDGEKYFLKRLTNRFWFTSKSCLWLNKIVHGWPSIKRTSWKGNDILLKED